MKQNSLYISILLLCLTLNVYGQVNQDTLGLEKVEVIKNFEVEIVEANKVKLKPQAPKINEIERVFNYNIGVVPLDIKYPDPIIRPFAMETDDGPDIYSFYAKLGYGNLNSPLIDAGYNFYLEDLYNFGIHAYHHAAEDSLDGAYKKSQITRVILDGSYNFYPWLQVSADANFSLSKRNLFGVGTDLDSSETFTNFDRKRELIQLGTQINNFKENDLGINYHLELNHSYSKIEDEEATEYYSQIPFKASKRIGDQQEIGVFGNLESAGLRRNENQYSNMSFSGAYFHWKNDYFTFTPGISYLKSKNQSSLFPDLSLFIPILGSKLGFSAEVKQQYFHNTLQNLSDRNPFLELSYRALDSINVGNSKYYKASFSGAIYDVEYNINGSYASKSQHAMFSGSTNDLRKFETQFIDFNVSKLNFDVAYQLNKRTYLSLAYDYLIFRNFDVLELQYMPTSFLHINALVQSTSKKWSINYNMKFMGKRQFLESNISPLPSQTLEGNNMLDLSFNFNYYLAKNVGLFLDLNNVLNVQYLEWENYSTFGANFHAGLLMRI